MVRAAHCAGARLPHCHAPRSNVDRASGVGGKANPLAPGRLVFLLALQASVDHAIALPAFGHELTAKFTHALGYWPLAVVMGLAVTTRAREADFGATQVFDLGAFAPLLSFKSLHPVFPNAQWLMA